MIDGKIATHAGAHTEDETSAWVRTQLADWRPCELYNCPRY